MALSETWGVFWIFLFGVSVSGFALSCISATRRQRVNSKAIFSTTPSRRKGKRGQGTDRKRAVVGGPSALAAEKSSGQGFTPEEFGCCSGSSAERNCSSSSTSTSSGGGGGGGSGGSVASSTDRPEEPTGSLPQDPFEQAAVVAKDVVFSAGTPYACDSSGQENATIRVSPGAAGTFTDFPFHVEACEGIGQESAVERAMGVTVEKLFAKFEGLSDQLRQRRQDVRGYNNGGNTSRKKPSTREGAPSWGWENGDAACTGATTDVPEDVDRLAGSQGTTKREIEMLCTAIEATRAKLSARGGTRRGVNTPCGNSSDNNGLGTGKRGNGSDRKNLLERGGISRGLGVNTDDTRVVLENGDTLRGLDDDDWNSDPQGSLLSENASQCGTSVAFSMAREPLGCSPSFVSSSSSATGDNYVGNAVGRTDGNHYCCGTRGDGVCTGGADEGISAAAVGSCRHSAQPSHHTPAESAGNGFSWIGPSMENSGLPQLQLSSTYAPAPHYPSPDALFSAISRDCSHRYDVSTCWQPRAGAVSSVSAMSADDYGGSAERVSRCFPPPLPLPRPGSGGNVLQQARACAPAQHLAVLHDLLAGGEGRASDTMQEEVVVCTSDDSSDSEDGYAYDDDDCDVRVSFGRGSNA